MAPPCGQSYEEAGLTFDFCWPRPRRSAGPNRMGDDRTEKLPAAVWWHPVRGHRLPPDVLPDLSAFRDLLVSYVKAGWRAAHTQRGRLPKGFEKSIAFDLVSIEDGSAVPQLEWDRDTAQLLLPDFKDELEMLVEAAYAKILDLIDGANGPRGTMELTSENIRALDRFGSSLLPDEKIEFRNGRGADGNVVYLDTYRRKRLITRSRDSYQTRFEDIGKLLGSAIDPLGTAGTITSTPPSTARSVSPCRRNGSETISKDLQIYRSRRPVPSHDRVGQRRCVPAGRRGVRRRRNRRQGCCPFGRVP